MIRKAKIEDLSQIEEIYAAARAFMAANGNPNQWGNSHPTRELLLEDIKKEQLYVIEDKDVLEASFVFFTEIEPDYLIIEEGNWRNDASYGTLHKVASRGNRKGVFKEISSYAKKFCDNLRMDTHQDNKVMQHLIESEGFEKCGIIYVRDRSPRIAYHYVAPRKLFFATDYGFGAHEKVLNQLLQSNNEPLTGYGVDKYSQRAKEKIKKACNCPRAQVEFVVGGTQTNEVVIHSMLQSFEGVIAANTGHIAVHEAGAIEFCGHKVLEVAGENGKITGTNLNNYLKRFYEDESYEHMVIPGMVYISHPTELGTLYSKKELEEISSICRDYKIPLYLDGARLGYGLMSKESDVSLEAIASLCDVFYIGGTKVGALCGEAIVFTSENRPKYFLTRMKQQGALLAKGRLLGIQFDTLFTDDLYYHIGAHGMKFAEQLKKGFAQKGYAFYIDSPTNQQFIIIENDKLEKLQEKVDVTVWEKLDEKHTVVRLVTSWATKEEEVKELLTYL